MIAGFLALAPMLWAAFWAEGFARWTARLPMGVRVAAPGLLCLVYALVAMARGIFEWRWFAVYLLLPVAVAAMLAWAAEWIQAEWGLAGVCGAAGAGAGGGSAVV